MHYNIQTSCYEGEWRDNILPNSILKYEIVENKIYETGRIIKENKRITIGDQNDDGIYEFQNACLQYLSTNGSHIGDVIRSACAKIIDRELPDLFKGNSNRAILLNHGQTESEWILALIEIIGVSVFNAAYNGKCLYAIDLHCAWDSEHGLSFLFMEDRIIGLSSIADFSCRGDSILGHAEYCVYDGVVQKL